MQSSNDSGMPTARLLFETLTDDPCVVAACRYLVTILSNQGGINLKPHAKTAKSDEKRLRDFKTKVTSVLTQLDVPDISIYAACEKDLYRKPRVGMWQKLLEDYSLESSEAVDLAGSIFVGDAGGRIAAKGGVPKDFACSDRSVPK
jgi:bifunctional polynucleotide phosphatase/kinase